MKRILLSFTLLTAAFTSAGCFGEIRWAGHASFIARGGAIHRARADAPTAIRAGGDWLSLRLDTAFFRDLPGLVDSDVVVGVEIRGVSVRPLRTVLEPTKSDGEHGFLRLSRALEIAPFAYRGGPIEVELSFGRLDERGKTMLWRRLRQRGDAPHVVDPSGPPAVHEAQGSLFADFFADAGAIFRYTFALVPAGIDSADARGVRLAPGRHVLLARPPANAPRPYAGITPETVRAHLAVRDSRLVWREGGALFSELPYLVLRVRRHAHQPSSDEVARAAQLEAEEEERALSARTAVAPTMPTELQLALDALRSAKRSVWRSWSFWGALVGTFVVVNIAFFILKPGGLQQPSIGLLVDRGSFVD